MMTVRRSLPIAAFLALWPAAVHASPAMIRAGYTNCTLCHVSPQGGGLLTDYGKGIDKAQSLLGGEYIADQEAPRAPFRHDVRGLLVHSTSTSPSDQWTAQRLWTQVLYRHALRVSDRTRVSLHAGIEAIPVSDRTRVTDGRFVAPQALFEYRPRDGFEIAIGRGTLPDGLGVPDRDALFRRGSAEGSSASPVHAKVFLWSERFELTPYVFGPGGSASLAAREHGAGVLGGLNVGTRAVVGASVRTRRQEDGRSDMFGVYTRMGFGFWGLLALHEVGVTDLDEDLSRRYVGYSQLFVAPAEWLVTSLTLERLAEPGLEETRLRPEVQIRISNTMSILFNVAADLSRSRGQRAGRVYGVQLAVKGMQ